MVIIIFLVVIGLLVGAFVSQRDLKLDKLWAKFASFFVALLALKLIMSLLDMGNFGLSVAMVVMITSFVVISSCVYEYVVYPN